MQTWGQVFCIFSSTTAKKKLSLQAQIAKKMKNPQCFSYISARIKHYLKKASGQEHNPAKIWYKQQKEV